MRTAILLREAEWLCMDNCQDYAARIGIAKGMCARHLGRASSGTPQRHPPAATPPPGRCTHAPRAEHPGARRSAAPRSLDRPRRLGEGRAVGGPTGERLRARLGKAGGTDFKRNCTSRVSRTQETHRRCTHVAPETTRDVVGIRRPNQTFLGANGRGQWEVGQRQA